MVRRAVSNGSMSASGSAGLGFDTRRSRKYSMKILNLGARRGDVQTSNCYIVYLRLELNSKTFTVRVLSSTVSSFRFYDALNISGH